ncbi:MAG: sugar nucleotide-binding protein, partial [candidate division Zixibacteria bacterium]|nr:sugar nucleotide-binding protein [candidate division Zixibacteria bacterium]
EMAEKIVEYAGLEDCPVIGVNSAQFPLAAHRPRMEAIDSLHCRLEGFKWMRPWQDALKAYITGTLKPEHQERIILKPV